MLIQGGIEILQPLQAGGKKEVFLVSHKEIGKVVLKCGKCNSPISLERIKREIEIFQSINSSYFPKTFHFEYDENGRFEILDEFIEGETLSKSKELFRFFA